MHTCVEAKEVVEAERGLDKGIHTAPLSQARFLESPRRAWNECSLAARALVFTAAPLFAILVAVK